MLGGAEDAYIEVDEALLLVLHVITASEATLHLKANILLLVT